MTADSDVAAAHGKGQFMGYRVRRLKFKTRSWKVQYQTRVKGRKDYDIPMTQYAELGFRADMTLEEVYERTKSLNSLEKLKRIQELRNKVKDRRTELNHTLNAHLPTALAETFEKTRLSGKEASAWIQARSAILDLQLKPADWAYNADLFYRWIKDKKYSYSYTQKILLVLNKWGKFVSRHLGQFYEQVPFPSHRAKESIVDQYGQTNESLPLTPQALESAASKLSVRAYNWLYLSVWLGLRPKEVDNLRSALKDPKCVPIDSIIWVYQSKLTGLSKNERYKPIPLLCAEQKKCVDIILEGNFKRPLNKTLFSVFNRHITCYGGRKGFTDLMLERGYSLEAISQWLGHRSIERTWKVYKNKQVVLIK